MFLRVAARRRCAAVWGFHVLIARRAGIADADVERGARGPAAPGWSDRDADLLAAADALYETGRLPEPLFRPLRALYDDTQLIELTLLVRVVDANCTQLEALQIPLDCELPPLPAGASHR